MTRACPEHAGLKAAGTAKAEKHSGGDSPRLRPRCCPSQHDPVGDSIEPREKEVKKESLIERIKPIVVNDLESRNDGVLDAA